MKGVVDGSTVAGAEFTFIVRGMIRVIFYQNPKNEGRLFPIFALNFVRTLNIIRPRRKMETCCLEIIKLISNNVANYFRIELWTEFAYGWHLNLLFLEDGKLK